MAAAAWFVRAMALISLLVAVTATAGCVTQIDSSSHMFGAGLTRPFNNSWVVYEQETIWRNKGDMTKVNLYYDQQTKCLRGIKATYGFNSSNARRIGVEGTAAGPFSTVDLKLQGTEAFIKADYKFSDNCVEYLKLYTNRNRVLALGNSDSSSPALTTWPIAAKGAFLGFFKGFTDVANVNAQVGQMTQLQLVWVVRTCDGATPPPTNPNPSAPPPANPSRPPATPKCTPATKLGCSAALGRCPTSTCPLAGLGLQVPMLCYGVNTQILPFQNYLKPCTNLACKLDKANCQSFGILGVGSYCTGTVVAMADETQLHPIAKLLVGLPCVEHTGPLLDIIPAISSTNNQGIYMAKAWKTCDCAFGAANVIQTMLSKNTSLLADLSIPDMGSVLTKIFNKSLTECNLEDMIKQWTSAVAVKLPLPKLVVPDLNVTALQALIPGFVVPSLVLPDISAPLLKLPDALKALPVFTITANKVAAVTQLLNITTLATLLVPAAGTSPLATAAAAMTLPDLSISGLKALASVFTATSPQSVSMPSLQTLLSQFKMGNLTTLLKPSNTTINKLDLSTVVAQWVAASSLNITLPTLLIGDTKLTALQALIPGFKLPCLVVPQAAAAFVSAAQNLPLFTIPETALKAVGQMLPGLTSVATVLVDKNVQTTLPTIKIGTITVPDFPKIALKLSSSLLPTVAIPGLPSMPSLLNVQSVNLNGMVTFFDNLESAFKNITTQATSAAMQQLQATLGEVASKLIPDQLEAAYANFTATAVATMQHLQSALGQAVSAVLPDSIEALFASGGAA